MNLKEKQMRCYEGDPSCNLHWKFRPFLQLFQKTEKLMTLPLEQHLVQDAAFDSW